MFGIHNGKGVWVDNLEEISQSFLSYYKKMLCTSIDNRILVERSIIIEGPLVPTQYCVLV